MAEFYSARGWEIPPLPWTNLSPPFSPVAMKIVEALAGLENDPKFNLGNHGYTLRRAKGKGASGFVAYKNDKAK